ncbi:MAG: hypothetical protein Q8Q09_27360 [Deltaproteobacteria bacterium]|nr:hypothetical protein [Deltaproteobacteria bacterium]
MIERALKSHWSRAAIAGVIAGLSASCGAPVVRPDAGPRPDVVVVEASLCPVGATYCSEVCVDTQSDLTNCGGCGVVCGFGVPCRGGRCDDGNCGGGQVRCGDRCADPRSDNAHCGGCGNPCDRGVACIEGRCAAGTCINGFNRCGSDCAELSSDARHCGLCGNRCPTGFACVQGRCAMSNCREGLMQCGATCTDTRFDPMHCGACDRACPSGQRCSLGACEEIPCSGVGMSRCAQSCVNLLSDATNCGRCNVRCPTGECNNGTCRADVLRPQWAVSFGTVGDDSVEGVALDAAGNVYVTGAFDGPMTVMGTTIAPRGRSDVFVASFTRTGTLRWLRGFGGRGADVGSAIALSSAGDVFVAGMFSGEFVSATQGMISGPGQLDGFAIRLDSATGTERAFLVVGGVGFDALASVSYRAGRLVLGGRFSDQLSVGSSRVVSAGRDDGLVVAVDPATLRPLWARNFGGVNDDRVNAVQLDDSGRVFFGGSFESSTAWGRSRIASAGQDDGFVAATDAVGTPLWAERFGGAEGDAVNGLALDGAGGLMATGYFRGTVVYPLGMTIAARGSDVVVIPFSGDGAAGMVRTWGSLNDDTAYGIARGSDGRWVLTGSLRNGADFGLGEIETYFLTSDAFVASFDSAWRPRSVPTVKGTREDVGHSIAIATDHSTAWGGTFTNGGNLGLGFVSGAGGTDGFLVYLGP